MSISVRSFYCLTSTVSHKGFLVPNFTSSILNISNHIFLNFKQLIFASVSHNWDINVTECKRLWLVHSSSTAHLLIYVSHWYYQTITSRPITAAQTPKAFCLLLNVISSEEGNFKAGHFIFMFFYITAKLFYLLLICTQVMPLACLCRNAIASFHMYQWTSLRYNLNISSNSVFHNPI